MDTDVPFLLNMHTCSHCVSCGHTRPHTAGRALSVFISFIALSKSPSATYFRKTGILTSTGQPFMHEGFLHWIQRFASSIACFSENPRATSSKLVARIFASCTGIFWRSNICIPSFRIYTSQVPSSPLADKLQACS